MMVIAKEKENDGGRWRNEKNMKRENYGKEV